VVKPIDELAASRIRLGPDRELDRDDFHPRVGLFEVALPLWIRLSEVNGRRDTVPSLRVGAGTELRTLKVMPSKGASTCLRVPWELMQIEGLGTGGGLFSLQMEGKGLTTAAKNHLDLQLRVWTAAEDLTTRRQRTCWVRRAQWKSPIGPV